MGRSSGLGAQLGMLQASEEGSQTRVGFAKQDIVPDRKSHPSGASGGIYEIN